MHHHTRVAPTPHPPVSEGVFCISLIQAGRVFTGLRHLIPSGFCCRMMLPWSVRHKFHYMIITTMFQMKTTMIFVWGCLCCIYQLYFVYDEVAFVAQNSRCISVLFCQQVEPLSQSIHHGQHYGPQEVQDIQDLLNHLTMNFKRHWGEKNRWYDKQSVTMWKFSRTMKNLYAFSTTISL